MIGQITVPDDFDLVGASKIERSFDGCARPTCLNVEKPK